MFNSIVFFDFETGDTNPLNAYPLQIAGIVLDGDRESAPEVEGSKFSQFMRPTRFIESDDTWVSLTDEEIMSKEYIRDDALNKNGIKREDILKFPSEKVVWNNFVDFVLTHKKPGKLPIAAGWNIQFDLTIANQLQKHYKTKDCFHENDKIDLMWLDWLFRCRDPEYKGKSFDLTRLHFGLKLEEGERCHEGATDVRQGSQLLSRYLKYIWTGARRNKYFANSFGDENGS